MEDWELWGDPREIERRKAERKRESLPLHVRKTHLAEEWGLARAEAAKAKAAADKPRQKAAGLLIASLKQEMKQLGGYSTMRLPYLPTEFSSSQLGARPMSCLTLYP